MKGCHFECPKCHRYGLNPYNKKGMRPVKTDDIDHLSCLYCSHIIYRARTNKEASGK